MSPSRNAESPQNPDSPSPIPPPPAKVSPLFQAPIATPSPPKSSSPSPQDSPSPSPLPGDVDAAPSWSTDEPTVRDLSAAEPSGTRSTGSGFKLSKAGLKAGVGAVFRQVCKMAGSVAGTQLEREHGVWTPDPDDVEDVAAPATSIIYRRLPDDTKGGDVIDLLALAFAIVGYVGNALQRRAELRAAIAQMEAQGINVHEDQAATVVHRGETLGSAPTWEPVTPAEFVARTRHA